MTSTDIESLWTPDAPAAIRVGDVVDATGKALDMQRLIMRRWGWPKLAAKMAAEWLDENVAHLSASGYMLPVLGDARFALHERLFRSVPGLLAALLEGVANRAQRDVRGAHRPVSAVEVEFVKDSAAGRVQSPIADEGLLTSIVNVVAGRLGIPADELRRRADFHRDDNRVRMTVWSSEVE